MPGQRQDRDLVFPVGTRRRFMPILATSPAAVFPKVRNRRRSDRIIAAPAAIGRTRKRGTGVVQQQVETRIW